jgi:hypothetical protein
MMMMVTGPYVDAAGPGADDDALGAGSTDRAERGNRSDSGGNSDPFHVSPPD